MIKVSLYCDYCGARHPQENKNHLQAIRLLRWHAAKEGWEHAQHTGKDYCPKCRRLMANANNKQSSTVGF